MSKKAQALLSSIDQASSGHARPMFYPKMNVITVSIRGQLAGGDLMVPHVFTNSPLDNIDLYEWQAQSVADSGFRVYQTEKGSKPSLPGNYATDEDIGIEIVEDVSNVELAVGETLTISAKIFDKRDPSIIYDELPYFSADTDYVNVVINEDGSVSFEALAAGEVPVVAGVYHFPTVFTEFTIQVKEAVAPEPVTYTITADPESLIVKTGETADLTVTVTASDASAVDYSQLVSNTMNAEVFTSTQQDNVITVTPVAEGLSDLRVSYGETTVVIDVMVENADAPEGEVQTMSAQAMDDTITIPDDFEARLAAVSTKDAFTALLAEIGMTPLEIGVDFSKGILLKDAKAQMLKVLS